MSAFRAVTTDVHGSAGNDVRWSPFHCLPSAALTVSGLLQLDTSDGEVELFRRQSIELRYDGEQPLELSLSALSRLKNQDKERPQWIDRDTDLTLIVTTHRVVFLLPKDKDARFCHMSNVHHIEPTGGATLLKWNASYKLMVLTHSHPGGSFYLVFRSSSDDRDQAEKVIRKSMERRAWENASRLASNNKKSHGKVGVDAILASHKQRQKNAARVADSAFQGDAEHLLQEATELVNVIRKYAVTVQKKDEGNDDNDDDDAAQLSLMLQDMGMTSALTTSSSSKQDEYYELLARQIADFLHLKWNQQKKQQQKNRRRRQNDIPITTTLTVTDLYCLFNRARGTNLISPDDLLTALKLPLSLGITLHTFPDSKVMVVQPSTVNEETMAKQIVESMKESTSSCLTPMEASRVLQTSVLLAQEHLQAAERLGYLCRDVTLETTRYYVNVYFK